MPSRIVKVEVSRRGPQGAIDPADRARIDAAVEVAEAITAVVQTATDAQAGAVAAAGQSSGFATAAQQAASTAATQAAAAIAPAAADAIRAQVATDADRAASAATQVAGAAADITALKDTVSAVSAPALRRSTDAAFRVHEVMDLGGGYHLPGLGGVSVQDHIRRLREGAASVREQLVGLAAKVGVGTVVNAVSDLGCDPNGLIDCRAIINPAINTLKASTSGPKTIFFPRGVYRIDGGAIIPQSGVSIIGAGRDETRFLPVSYFSAFLKKTGASPSNYLENVVFANFSIDGSQQIIDPGRGSYWVETKGFFFQGFRRCLFTDIALYDTAATSMGIDFAEESIIQRVLVRNGGRLAYAVGAPGASGIGIGTGWAQSEPLLITDCIAEDCTNYGIFVERQGDQYSLHAARHTIVSGCVIKGNAYGLGEAGCDGTIFASNQVTDNTHGGVAIHGGTVNEAHPGNSTMLSGNLIARNGGPGVKYDGTKNSGTIGYSSEGNRIEANAGPGHSITGGAGAVDDFSIADTVIARNGGHGIHVAQGTLTNFDITGARLLNNTGSAVRLDATVTGGRVAGCTMRDLRGGVATQTGSITGSGALTDFDIAENVGVGCGPITLTGAQTRVTTGRNVGM